MIYYNGSIFASNFLVIILLRGVVLSVCLVHLCVSRFVFFEERCIVWSCYNLHVVVFGWVP